MTEEVISMADVEWARREARRKAERKKAESVPWDWADYEALWMLALRHHLVWESDQTPVSFALDRCAAGLEDEQWRAQVAERIRRIAG